MTITARTYRLGSYKFYPRPNHFKKRLDSLIPRFKNVIGAFGEPFHNKEWRHNIDESHRRVSKPIVVSLMGEESHSFDLHHCVIHEADEWATVNDPQLPTIFQTAGLYITVCYITVEDTGAKGKATVQKHVNNCLDQYRKNPELYETVFVFCELPASYECSESEKTSFRAYINEFALQKSAEWPGPSRIVLGPDHVTLGSHISDYIEEKLLDTFHLMYEYLDRFMYKSNSQGAVLGDVAHAKDVEDALFNFVRNAIELADMRQQLIPLEEDTRAELVKFVDDVIDLLAKKLKCVLVVLLSVKLGLKRDVCHTCLNVIRFDKIVRKHLSSSTQIDLKKLYEFSNGYEEKIQKVKKEGHKLYKGNDYMIPRLQNDLSAALNKVETELKKAVTQISIMGKMMFEIEGYFRLAGEPVGESQAKLPADLQTDLLKIGGVVGAGTIYGILEIHVKDMIQINELKTIIDDTIRHHYYSKQYVVRTVVKEATQLYEQGNLIEAFPGHRGTIGIFVEGQSNESPGINRLYALTCAHVVDPFDMQECPVYLIDNGRPVIRLGVSTPEFTVKSGSVEGATLIDIAAVLVDTEVQGNCIRGVKNEDGDYARSFFIQDSTQDLVGQTVYKFGAESNLTRGLVCSRDYLAAINKDIFPEYSIIIDSRPGTATSFAQPGDSGSVICATSIGRGQTFDSVAVVAMVSAGMEVAGHVSNLCVSFPLSNGLETLRNAAGLHLETP